MNVALWERITTALNDGLADLDDRDLLVDAAQGANTADELPPDARAVLDRLEVRAAERRQEGVSGGG